MKTGKTEIISGVLFSLLSPAVLFFAMEWLLRNPFHEKWGMKPWIIVFNLIFFYLLELFLLGAFGSLKAALITEGVIMLLFGFLDLMIYKFRGSTIVPWDIFSLRTALSVADNFSFKPDKKTIIIFLDFLVCFAVFAFCKLSIKKEKKLRAALSLISLLFFMLLYVPFVQSDKTIKKFRIYDKLFTPATMTMRDGMAFTFIYDMKFLKVEKPPKYNAKNVGSSLKDEYGPDSLKSVNEPVSEETPNIIVVMCEAFSDPGVLQEFQTNKDFMPCIRSLMNSPDTISGSLYVSVLGGNTPNTEYEFLTGNTCAFLPQGSIPFQQFITKETPAMPSLLKELGYDTVAMHPYYKTGWDRDRVYPLLGFDEMHFIDYFKNRDPEYIRKYISDETLFNEIINLYKEKGRKTPLFSFNVTMQNHSEYSGDLNGFEPSVHIDGMEDDSLINRYLSLEKETDSAFKDLISYFESIDDPTVIVFFGDHQPTDMVVEPIWNLYDKTGKNLHIEDQRKRYIVPFLIWANYPIEGASNINTSVNYLGNLTLEAAGINLSGYRSFLNEERKKLPVITTMQETTADGTTVDMDKYAPELHDYYSMQYYEMFDFSP